MDFTHIAVVSASTVILHHKNKVSFPLFTLQLLFLKQNSPQKCNTGTCHWTTEPKTMNSLHANKCIIKPSGKKKKRPFFCLACISHELPFFCFTLFAAVPNCYSSVQQTESHFFSRKREGRILMDERCIFSHNTGSKLQRNCAGKRGTTNRDGQKPFKSHLTTQRHQKAK